MKILHLTDPHGKRLWYRWLQGHAARHDLVCVAGDLVDGPRDVNWVARAFRDLDAPLAVCSGNHDDGDVSWVRRSRHRPDTWIDGDSFELRGVAFRCVPWNEPVPGSGAGEVWLAHAPPTGSLTARTRYGMDYGDFELSDACQGSAAPRLVLSGHVHEALAWCARYGRSIVCNPGHDAEGRVPRHILIDLTRGFALLNPYGTSPHDRQHLASAPRSPPLAPVTRFDAKAELVRAAGAERLGCRA
jgi:Icc-related predicted phosphoesterase